jgi:simple sugar transport system ATP-binding protein
MLVELVDVALQFGSVHALRGVSLSVSSGEIVCLLGDNGAGKSSLIRVLSGVHAPTSGRYLIDGDAVHFNSPREALDRGIATVHQDLALVSLMPVWRNFILGAEPTKGAGLLRRIDERGARDQVTAILNDFGIALQDPAVPMAKLSGGERQSVAIARAMHRGARMLILDEPTAALGVKQAEIVLRNIALARERRIAVLFVTHNPQHALRVGERFVVLGHGEVVASLRREDVDAVRLGELMSGQDRERSVPGGGVGAPGAR